MAISTSKLIPYPSEDFQYADSNEIEKAITSQEEIKSRVAGIVKTYYTINVADAMRNLTQVGELIQLAYCGSKGFKCSASVIKILGNYQTLIKDSHVTCNTFVEVSLKALKIYRVALLFAEKNKFPKVLKMILETADVAKQMADESNKLSEAAQALCKESRDALVQANNDQAITNEQKQKTEQAMGEQEAKQKRLEVLTKSLSDSVDDIKQKEQKIEQEAREAREKAFTVGIVSAVIGPLASIAGAFLGTKTGNTALGEAGGDIKSSVETVQKEIQSKKDKIEKDKKELEANQKDKEQELKKKQEELAKLGADAPNKTSLNEEISKLQADISKLKTQIEDKDKAITELKGPIDQVSTLLEKEVQGCQNQAVEIAKQKAALQKELREANADLAESITRLKNTTNVVNNLNQSIQSLEITIKTLGKIKTVFENARLFWIGVEKHCRGLSDVKGIKDTSELAEIDDGSKIEFLNAIKLSGLGWLGLAQINLIASKSMEGVNKTVDEIMKNLPDANEALEKIKSLSASMLTQLAEDNKALENG